MRETCPYHPEHLLDYVGEWYFDKEDSICEFYRCSYTGLPFVAPEFMGDELIGPLKMDGNKVTHVWVVEGEDPFGEGDYIDIDEYYEEYRVEECEVRNDE